MTRTVSFPTDRLPLPFLAAWALLPLALAACGERTPATRTATAGGTTSAAVAAATTPRTAKPAAAGEALAEGAAPSVAVRYADAESVYRARDYTEAAARFEDYTAAHPADAHGHYMLGLAYWKAGDAAHAEEALQRALELDPDNVKAWLNSARVLLDERRPREALERVQAALELDSTSVDALRLLARTQALLGEPDSAVATYRRVLAANDHDVWAMNNLGLLHLEQDDVAAALPPLARAVQLRPTAPVFQNNLGIALERSGRPAAARRAYEAALRADSSYTKAATSLARVLPLADSTATPPAPADTTDVEALAEEFRMQVRMWQESAPQLAPEE
ncbi:MAG TPA: tetratricopeptide repeat protein [Gemmatimonadales bacterium]|nr:tetratricopeptide repeat protein [Gemmatimonadales bacterium]